MQARLQKQRLLKKRRVKTPTVIIQARVVLPAALAASFCFALSAALANEPAPTAVFDFGLADTSLQGRQADQEHRLQALNVQLRNELRDVGCCQIVSLAPIAQQIQNIDLWNCNGCDIDFARKIGAAISVTGWVQKVSSLILNINLVAHSVATGKVIEAGSVDIRGNTDESWSRGLTYLLHERLHPAKWR